MGLTWWDAAQPVVAGLAGMLGVHVVEDVLALLRRRGLCPARWNR
jgi:xanthosine utilization system XapX-like protein